MEYQLEERTRDMQDLLETCQTRVSAGPQGEIKDIICNTSSSSINIGNIIPTPKIFLLLVWLKYID